MSIQFISSTTVINNTTINVPTGVLNNDMLVWSFANSASSSPYPTGWTIIQTIVLGAGPAKLLVALRVANNEPASYTATATTPYVMSMRVYRGVNTNFLSDGNSSNSGVNATPSTPTLSGLSTNNDLLIGIYDWGTSTSNGPMTETGILDPITADSIPYVSGTNYGLWVGHQQLGANSAAGQSGQFLASATWSTIALALSPAISLTVFNNTVEGF